MKNPIILGFLCLFFFLLSVTAASGDIYYVAAEGDIVQVKYQRYEANGTPKDGGILVVYLGDAPIPPDLQDQWSDAITVIHGFWKIITGGTGRAGHNYGEPMKEGDKKEFQGIPTEDGYTDPGHELYGETLYFDVELNSIYYDAVEEPFGIAETETESSESEITPSFALIVAFAGLLLLKKEKKRRKNA